MCVFLCVSGFSKARLYVNLRLMNTLIASAVLYESIWRALYVHKSGKFKVKPQREIQLNWQPNEERGDLVRFPFILVELVCLFWPD